MTAEGCSYWWGWCRGLSMLNNEALGKGIEMTAERFCEIMLEEGYPLSFVKALWNSEYSHHETEERLLRFTARKLKKAGIVDRWLKAEEDEERNKQ